MATEPRSSVGCREPVVHGGVDYAEIERLGLRADDLVDFSVSTNPLGPSPAALRAAREADLGRYPDRQALALRRSLASALGLDPDQLLVGNGSAELIWLLALAFLQPGDAVLVVGPTFGEYRAAAQMMGAIVQEWTTQADQRFAVDVPSLIQQLQRLHYRLTLVCNPNNPTGTWLTRDDLQQMRAATAGLLVVDEAYLDLSGRESPGTPLIDAGNVVLLRSMTKDHGLPGLRLGYAVAAAPLIRSMALVQPPWSVNAAAQAAGLAALSDRQHVAAGRAASVAARAYLEPRLEALGYRCLPSAANFWLVEVGDASRLRRRLLERGILVRDCTSFGLPGYIRIAARPLDDCARLIAELTALSDPSPR